MHSDCTSFESRSRALLIFGFLHVLWLAAFQTQTAVFFALPCSALANTGGGGGGGGSAGGGGGEGGSGIVVVKCYNC